MIDSAGEVEGLENVLWLELLFTALLAGAVLYLFISQRSFQRIDYKSLIDQEDQERRLMARLAYVEQLIADLVAYDHRRRQDLEQLADDAQTEITRQLDTARERLVEEIFRDPDSLDRLLHAHSGAQQVDLDQLRRKTLVQSTSRSPILRQLLEGQRQQQIAGMLEEGYDPRDVAHILGVSRQEVEMISVLMFDTRSA